MDSVLCSAAIHAGALDGTGGCVAARTVPGQLNYTGSTLNGVTSHEFPSWFPRSIEFKRLDASEQSGCTPNGWGLLVANLVLLLVWMLLRPGRLAFFMAFVQSMFWYALFAAGKTTTVAWVVAGIGKTIPAMGTAFAWYHISGHTTVPDLSKVAYAVDTFLFYVIPGFVGVNLNMFVYILPDINLTFSSATKSAANSATVIVLLVAVLIGALYQAYVFFRANQLRIHLLALFLAFGSIAVVCIWGGTVGYTIHLHHSLFGLLLIPFTKGVTRVSMILQAVLLGVFINGVVFWGIESAPLQVASSSGYSSGGSSGGGGGGGGGGGRPVYVPPKALWTGAEATHSAVSLAWEHLGRGLNCTNNTNVSSWGVNGSTNHYIPGQVTASGRYFEEMAMFKLYMNGVLLFKGYTHNFTVTGV